ncbi:hypothetical protein CCE28_14385 [Anaeromicrobium sediminis]|uniref:DUF2087 domain-containing protein n=1 Tax=Anaeromicrobium sediminis TaxID=1478221 RepID=A0A267MGH8_9FIRM|nr:hypothetical protein CCE28_14385 [Anaeromicrobium sediminis]
MKDVSELFWKASTNELKDGYVKRDGKYICLVCGKFFHEDVIYPKGNVFYNAKKATKEHIKDAHNSMFHVLINMDKKYTGLSEIQSKLLEDFYMGSDDEEVSKNEGIAKSTVRNHRFRLKEKQKQAKVLLTIMNMVEERQKEEEIIMPIHKGAKMLDERYAITKEHESQVLGKFLNKDGTLKVLPRKEKDKIVILFHMASQFKCNTKYNEMEVNNIIKCVYDDYVTVRRYLIEYGFLQRNNKGSIYWVNI